MNKGKSVNAPGNKPKITKKIKAEGQMNVSEAGKLNRSRNLGEDFMSDVADRETKGTKELKTDFARMLLVLDQDVRFTQMSAVILTDMARDLIVKISKEANTMRMIHKEDEMPREYVSATDIEAAIKLQFKGITRDLMLKRGAEVLEQDQKDKATSQKKPRGSSSSGKK